MRKKNTGQLLFHEESIHEISKTLPAWFKSHPMHKKARQTDGRTDKQTDERISPKQYAPPTSLSLGA